MNIIDALLGEHGAFQSHFTNLEKLATETKSADELRGAAKVFAAVLLSHAKIEEEVLFPALEARIGPAGPLAVMREEHQDIDRLCADLCKIQDLNHGRGLLGELLDLVKVHFMKEEEALFRIARDSLAPNELQDFLGQWSDTRRVVT